MIILPIANCMSYESNAVSIRGAPRRAPGLDWRPCMQLQSRRGKVAQTVWKRQQPVWGKGPEPQTGPVEWERRWLGIMRNAQAARLLKLRWQLVWKWPRSMPSGGIRTSIPKMKPTNLRLWRARMAQRKPGLQMSATGSWAMSYRRKAKNGMRNKFKRQKSKISTHIGNLMRTSRERMAALRNRLRRRDGF